MKSASQKNLDVNNQLSNDADDMIDSNFLRCFEMVPKNSYFRLADFLTKVNPCLHRTR
jgi:hypothetical protein